MSTIDEALARLEKSKFRSSFHLSSRELEYIEKKGIETVRSHGRDFVRTRLAPAEIPNDGKQTPMRGHPIFVAQHACACCCRSCLEKWYKVRRGVTLSESQQEKILNLLMAWIMREVERAKKSAGK